MDTLHGRAGPGARKRGRGGFGRQASTPNQAPSSSESAYLYATASDGNTTITPSAGLTDLSGARSHETSGDVPEALPAGAVSEWHEVEGRRFRLVVRRRPDGGRLIRLIQDLLLDEGIEDTPLDDDEGLAGVRELVLIPPCSGDAAAALEIPAGRDLVHS